LIWINGNKKLVLDLSRIILIILKKFKSKKKKKIRKKLEDIEIPHAFSKLLKEEEEKNRKIEEELRKKEELLKAKKVVNFPQLSEEDEEYVDEILDGEIDPVVEAFNVTISHADILTLADCQWLNDEVFILFYFIDFRLSHSFIHIFFFF